MKFCMIYNAEMELTAGTYYIDRAYGRYVESLLPYVEEIILCNPVAMRPSRLNGLLPAPPKVSVRPLPYYSCWTESCRTIPRAFPVLRQAIMESDLIYLRIPSPLAFMAFALGRLHGKPVLLHIVGDQRWQYDASKYRGLSAGLARLAVEFNEWSTQRMVNRSLTIVQGEELARKHGRPGNSVFNLIESPISAEDVVQKIPAIGGNPLHLVYVGALLEKKGVHDLILALPLLNAVGIEWSLKIIGSGRQDLVLRHEVERAGVSGSVQFLGAITLEKELFLHLRCADICIVPSRAEGVPRVILEAMAGGTAVVATRVGGISGIVKDGQNGLLVAPGAPSEIAEAILRLTRDHLLFERLIQNGRETALLYTRERHAACLFELFSSHLSLDKKVREQ